MSASRLLFGLMLSALTVSALSDAELKLLQDEDGWEYLAISDANNGVAEQHACFVEGHPNPEACHGTLAFTTSGNFTQKIYIHGGLAERHGTYDIDSDQITFTDELGTKDGPYAVHVDVDKKQMRMNMTQAGVEISATLELEKEHRKKDHS